MPAPTRETTVDGCPLPGPPASTATEAPNTRLTAAPLTHGASPWRFALVTASGPLAASKRRTPAWAGQRTWQNTLTDLFTQVDFLVTPTLTIFPPTPDDGQDLLIGRCTIPVNLGGVPALALPVPTKGPLPASIQLIGPPHSEERLLAAGAWLESTAVG